MYEIHVICINVYKPLFNLQLKFYVFFVVVFVFLLHFVTHLEIMIKCCEAIHIYRVFLKGLYQILGEIGHITKIKNCLGTQTADIISIL